MMIFPSSMKPRALVQNSGKPMTFTCDLCSTSGTGYRVDPGHGRAVWAVLPEEWEEVEDRRANAKKQFLVCCDESDCINAAKTRSY